MGRDEGRGGDRGEIGVWVGMGGSGRDGGRVWVKAGIRVRFGLVLSSGRCQATETLAIFGMGHVLHGVCCMESSLGVGVMW